MISSRNMSIKNKLIVIILTVTLPSLMVGFTVNSIREYASMKERLVNESMMNAKFVSEYCVSPLDFGYQDEATANLSRLETIPAIANGCVYDVQGSLFASYNRKGAVTPPPMPKDVARGVFDGKWLHIFRQIKFRGEIKGAIYLRVSTAELSEGLKKHLASMALIGGGVMIVACFLAVGAQRFISRPILDLADFTKRISREADYSIRIKKRGSDEIGALYDSFNKMLEQIHIRKKERDRAEEEKTRLIRIIENTSDLVSMAGLDAALTYMNHAGKEMLGLAPDHDVKGEAIADFHPDWAFEIINNEGIPASLEKGAWQGETALLTRDGVEIPVLQVIISHTSPDGELEYMSTIMRDITERVEAERETVRLRNYLQNVFDSMPSVLIGVDSCGRVTRWNKSAERLTGIAPGAARGKALPDVFPRMASEMEKIDESIRTGETRQDRMRPFSTAKDGRWEDVTVYPLIANGVEGAVIRVDDVTDKVRMEEMMIQSEKMLSVGGLAAGMAHEINNPLAGMMQTANVLAGRLGRDVNFPANLRAAEAAGASMEAIRGYMEARGVPRMLEAISESGRRVAAIVDNMLSFARKSEDRASFHLLSELLDRTLELAATDYNLKKRHDFKRIEIGKEYENDLPPALCEGAKIQQVLLNILGNGAQAMQNAGVDKPRFILRMRFEKERRMVRLEIEDNGPGMDEATRKRVFEPFFTTKPVGVGTGLGLSVSYFIVTENHGGEMTVESHPGAGAKFIIRLPLEGGMHERI
ncbi:MAG: PAS domain S-box protein [Desulfobacterales bacterium]|nr:PAS domain S-box protein [Desulfobacterales bacterium]